MNKENLDERVDVLEDAVEELQLLLKRQLGFFRNTPGGEPMPPEKPVVHKRAAAK